MKWEDIHWKLQEWAIAADNEGHDDLSASLWTSAEYVADVLNLDDEEDTE